MTSSSPATSPPTSPDPDAFSHHLTRVMLSPFPTIATMGTQVESLAQASTLTAHVAGDATSALVNVSQALSVEQRLDSLLFPRDDSPEPTWVVCPFCEEQTDCFVYGDRWELMRGPGQYVYIYEYMATVSTPDLVDQHFCEKARLCQPGISYWRGNTKVNPF